MKKRILSVILAVTLFIGMIPLGALPAYAANTDQVNLGKDADVYVADGESFDSWKDEFSPNSTEFTGSIWTDKSVFESGNTGKYFNGLKVATATKNEETDELVMGIETELQNVTVGKDNFLVTLSALGSTKEIVGYSTLPTDTVYILDLSNSMETEEMYAMVEATNKSIEQLLNLNKYNRVGVVVYATEAFELLPLDRYDSTMIDNNGTEADKTDDFKVYLELYNFRDNGNSNSGQIRAVVTEDSTETKISVDLTAVDDWDAVASVANNVTIGKGYWSRVGQAVRNELVRQGVVLPEEITIKWEDVAESRGNRSWQKHLTDSLTDIVITNKINSYYVTNSNGNKVSVSANVGGATYIQGGIDVALEMFLGIEDTTIETGLIQGGTKRMPSVVLMTDGAPTYATTTYTNAENTITTTTTDVDGTTVGSAGRNLGSGSSVDDILVFPTQLSAANLKKQIEEHYGRDSLFYTLGLDIEYAEAYRVLDPENQIYSSETINTYWANSKAGKEGYVNVAKDNEITAYTHYVEEWQQNNNGRWELVESQRSIVRQEDGNNGLDNYRYYTDEYFNASGAEDLIKAFDDIVEAIVLQSRYYPTLVKNGEHNFEGYITFEDELGGFVEVENVKGMLIGGILYTGNAFLNALNKTTLFGNANKYTEYGEELLLSIAERVNIEEDQARTLLAFAWRSGASENSGQLRTENYIGWYADAEGKYIGHWDDKVHTKENYPKNAKYINKCYIFQGELGAESDNLFGADMMHIVVQVHEDITTGHQCVIWKIPASLIPLITYEVAINDNKLTDGLPATLTSNIETASPISLLFEVGLKDTINSVNLTNIVSEDEHVAVNHKVEANGKTIGYAFYSNRWGKGHTNDGSGVTDKFDVEGNMATVSHFHPSVENERYYYNEDTIIYDSSKTIYKGSKPSGTGYFFAYKIIKEVNGEMQVTTQYLPISASTLEAEGSLAVQQLEDGSWYVPAGQIHQSIEDYIINKASDVNKTDTLSYAVRPEIVNHQNDGYHIYDYLGNNGRWIMYSAQGIKLSKIIDDATATSEFTFEIILDKAVSQDDLKVIYIDGTPATSSLSADGKIITVTIKNGETVYIVGLPTGAAYEISENYHKDYRVKEVTVNGVIEKGGTAQDTVEEYLIDDIVFTNTVSSHMGNLEVAKIVTVPDEYGTDYIINPDLVFKVQVGLENFTDVVKEIYRFDATGVAKVPGIEAGVYETKQVKAVMVSVNKETKSGNVSAVVFTDDTTSNDILLAHEDSFTITNLPENVTYTVSEPELDKAKWNSTTIAGTIVADTTKEAHLINNLVGTTTVGVDNINIEITKNIVSDEADPWHKDWEFAFLVERYVPSKTEGTEGTWKPITETVECATKEVKTVKILGESANVEFGKDDIGKTYYYRISETVGNIEGITYDKTHRYFTITVTDVNTDGVPELTVNAYNGTEIKTEHGITTVSASFYNYYQRTVKNISLKKSLLNNTGIDIPLDTFEFVFCGVNHANDDGCTDSTHYTGVLKPNTNGDLTFPLIYTENSLEDVMFEWTETDEGGNEVVVDEITLSEGESVPEGAVKSKTFTYYLREANDGIKGMYYDPSVYKVEVVATVTKTDTGSNTLTVSDPVYTKIIGVDNNGNVVNIDSPTALEEGKVPTFNNSYVLNAENAKANIQISKTLNGRNILADDNFTFKVEETNSSFNTVIKTLEPKVINGNGESNTGKVSVILPELSKAGTYYYKITEQVGSNAAITYDNTTYHITIIVDRNDTVTNDGKVIFGDALVVKSVTVNKVGGDTLVYDNASLSQIQPLEFVNTYTISKKAEVVLGGDKELVGKSIEAGEFKIGLYNEQNELIEETTTAAVSGAFEFSAISYDTAGTHTYYIKEIGSTKNSYLGGSMSLDTSSYKVEVTVIDDGKGTLTANKVIKKDDFVVDRVVFNNIFTPKPVNVSFVAEKAFYNESNEIIAVNSGNWSTFQFELYEAADKTFSIAGKQAVATVSQGQKINGKYEKASDGTLNFTHTISSYVPDYNVEGFDNRFGYFMVDIEYPSAGTYYYVLKEVEGNAPATRYDTKSYYITVVVYDALGDGNLKESISIKGDVHTTPHPNEDDIRFVNGLIKKEVDEDIIIKKTFENTTGIEIPMSSFRFGLYEIDTTKAETLPLADRLKIVTVDGVNITSTADSVDENIEDGEFIVTGDASIHLTFNNDDIDSATNKSTYTYYVKEIIPENTLKVIGMEYDHSIYRVDVVVGYVGTGDNAQIVSAETYTKVVDAKGKAIAKADQKIVNQITFDNEYKLTPIENHSIKATKKLTGRDLLENDDFTFEVYKANVTLDNAGKEMWTFGDAIATDITNTNEKKNNITLNLGTLDKVDTYRFIIQETKGNAGGVTYDDTQYRVTVITAAGEGDDAGKIVVSSTSIEKVTFAKDNESVTSVAEIEFANEYSSVGTLKLEDFEVTKILKGREWLEDESFEIAIFKAKKSLSGDLYVTGEAIQTLTFTEGMSSDNFEDIHLPTADTYYYIIKEVVPTNNSDKAIAMEYDKAEYWITAEAKDVDFNGVLTVTTTIDKINGDVTTEDVGAANFENVYTPTDAKAVIEGTKVLEGRDIEDNEFTFGLYKANSNGIRISNDPIATVKNKSASFKFENIKELTFDSTGTYHFVVKEIAGNNPTMTYDTTEHYFKVDVVHNEEGIDGKLYVKINDGEKFTNATGKVNFINKFTPTKVEININKHLKVTSNAAHGLAGFEFQLTDNKGDKVADVKTDKDGKASITLDYSEKHLDENQTEKTYIYKLREVNLKEANMEYDNNVFTVEVTLKVEDGKMVAEIKQNNAKVSEVITEFYNTYSGTEDKPDTNDNPEDSNVVVIPYTGDDSNNIVYLTLMVVSALFIAVILVYRKKEMKSLNAKHSKG